MTDDEGAVSVITQQAAACVKVVSTDYKVDATDLRLSGLEAFTFDYVVKWPVSLVISRKVCLILLLWSDLIDAATADVLCVSTKVNTYYIVSLCWPLTRYLF